MRAWQKDRWRRDKEVALYLEGTLEWNNEWKGEDEQLVQKKGKMERNVKTNQKMNKDRKESEQYIEEIMPMLMQWKQKNTKLVRMNKEISQIIEDIIAKWR